MARFLLMRRAALIVTVSTYTLAQFRLGAQGGRARYAVLHDGVDPVRFSPEAAALPAARLRRELGLGDDAYPVLAVVGQLTPWKGQDDAIRAVALLLPAYPATRLLIVGEAKFTDATARYDTEGYRRTLDALAAELEITDRVLFTGERTDMPAVMGALDVLLAPSWSEPFGLVILEAMAVGKAVVATKHGGPADIIRDGLDGILIESRQPGALTAALVALLADEPGLGTLGAAARRRVLAHFTVERQAACAAELYRSLLSPAPEAHRE